MNDGKNRYILSRTLSRLEASLPSEFFQRVHRSFIVNMNHVLHFEKIKKQVVINHSNENWTQNILVSASYIEKIREMFRSEEHTSELQSRPHLVCRLLLEKK